MEQKEISHIPESSTSTAPTVKRSNKRQKTDTEIWNEQGGYMNVKIQKLSEKYNKDKDGNSEVLKSNIFAGIVIFVNGYTEPTSDELRQIMIEHGGRYEHYYFLSKVTHIIATAMAFSKRRKLADRKVVHPRWITESVEKGVLLPYENYLLFPPKVENKVTDMFTVTKSSLRVASPAVRIMSPDDLFSSEKSDSFECSGQELLSQSKLLSGGQEIRLVCQESQKSNLSSQNNGRNESKIVNEDGRQSRLSEKADSLIEHPGFGFSPLSDISSCEWDDSGKFSSVAARVPTSTPHPSRRKSLIQSNNVEQLESEDNEQDNTIDLLLRGLCSPEVQQSSPELRSPSPKFGQNKPIAMLNADHPNFLAEYYNNSRLHHISEWSLRLKDMVNKWRRESTGKFKGRERLAQKYGTRVTPLDKEQKVYMHVDMDCFFVSVAIRNRPDLKGKPVVVAHSKGDSARNSENSTSSLYSMSQIACCSYEARQAGVKNGMMMGRALQLCKDLLSVPYDFEGYAEVSTSMYECVTSYTLEVEAVSCDELYVDCTPVITTVNISAEEFAREVRDEIRRNTGCNVSAGLGPNLLLARLATRKGKPNGQYRVENRSIAEFMSLQLAKDLPDMSNKFIEVNRKKGVGRSTSHRLGELRVETCQQLQALSLSCLKREFGNKLGETIYKLCRGQDERFLKLDQIRQSVSADVNYGIRLTHQSQVDIFLRNLVTEVQKRLQNAGLKGKQLTLKLKIKSPGAPAVSAKFMGHGICDNATKSTNIREATQDAEMIYQLCANMYNSLQVKPADLRGVGIQVSKLELYSTPAQPTIAALVKRFPKQIATHDIMLNKATTIPRQAASAVNSAKPARALPTQLEKAVPTLCGFKSFEEIKKLLQRWYKFSKIPQRKDKITFTKYLTELVKYRELELVTQIMKYFYYLVLKCGKWKWLQYYTLLRQEITTAVNSEYDNAELLLPKLT